MDRGLYIAASGMAAEMVRQDQIASDLSNASTPGYKADRATQRGFAGLLLQNTRTGAPVGRLGLGVAIDRVVTDLRPQALRETGEPLDFAIAGEGFFAVRTPAGVRYTRAGQFAADARGVLVTPEGHEVLGAGGGPVRVGRDGRADPRALRVVTLTGARKEGDNLWSGAPGSGRPGTVRAGALEGSGTDAARAMVSMIASLRAFEAGQRVITTIDETLGKTANQVGSLGG
jgi:flagellar basal-body rod protein FlgG